MLFIVVFFLLSGASSTTLAQRCPVETSSCESSSLEDLSLKEVLSFKASSLKKREEMMEREDFKRLVEDLQRNPQPFAQSPSSQDKGSPFEKGQFESSAKEDFSASFSLTPPQLYLFVSFSLGEKALLNLAEDAKSYGATLVLRGFKEGSYVKTAQALQQVIEKTGQGFLIDPELFALFGITSVPTLILSKPFPCPSSERLQTPLHDRLQGHVSLRYALDLFGMEGDLQEEATTLLTQRGSL